jgi:hypothetical protein
MIKLSDIVGSSVCNTKPTRGFMNIQHKMDANAMASVLIMSDAKQAKSSTRYMEQKDLYVNNDSPTTELQRYSLPVSNRTIRHRKLACMAILFICNYVKERDATVIYVGNSPDKDVDIIREMFPTIQLITFFVSEDNIFNREVALTHKGKYLISVYKTKTIPVDSSPEESMLDDTIHQDNERHRQWIEAMQPKASMIRFRVPLGRRNISYLGGTLYFQPWSSPYCTEFKLLSTLEELNSVYVWDIVKLHKILNRHNMLTREIVAFIHPALGVSVELIGMSNDYDSYMTLYVLWRYSTRFLGDPQLVYKTLENFIIK